ncbi:MAG: hypothetical protein HOW73_43245 [Polyangiaceae bacterium]|nr:hypothetical protein [Polyangiaceae bacterium]
MIAPVIHIKGSTLATLRSENDGARCALRIAIEALEDAAPRARDFEPLGSGAFGEACREHGARVSRLKATLRELDELGEHLDDAYYARELPPRRGHAT